MENNFTANSVIANSDLVATVLRNPVILGNILSNFRQNARMELSTDLLTCRSVSRFMGTVANFILTRTQYIDLKKSGLRTIEPFLIKKAWLQVLARSRMDVGLLEIDSFSHIDVLRLNFLYADPTYGQTVKELLEKLPQIEVLELGFLKWEGYTQDLMYREEPFETILLKNLKKVAIHVDYGARLVPFKIFELLPPVPELSLDFRKCDKAFAERFLPELEIKWPEIEGLNLTWETYYSERSIDLKPLTRMKSLKKLSLKLINVTSNEEEGWKSTFKVLKQNVKETLIRVKQR